MAGKKDRAVVAVISDLTRSQACPSRKRYYCHRRAQHSWSVDSRRHQEKNWRLSLWRNVQTHTPRLKRLAGFETTRLAKPAGLQRKCKGITFSTINTQAHPLPTTLFPCAISAIPMYITGKWTSSNFNRQRRKGYA